MHPRSSINLPSLRQSKFVSLKKVATLNTVPSLTVNAVMGISSASFYKIFRTQLFHVQLDNFENIFFWKLHVLKNNMFSLMILTGKDWCFTRFSTEMTGWLLLIFFICLHSQLSSLHSIIGTDV